MSATFASLFCMSAFALIGIVVLGIMTMGARKRPKSTKVAGSPRTFWWDDDFAGDEGHSGLRMLKVKAAVPIFRPPRRSSKRGKVRKV